MLDFYRAQSPITDPGAYKNLYDPLPVSPDELRQIIHGLLIHRLVAGAYLVSLSPIQRNEEHLRTVQEMLERMQELDKDPLNTPRGAKDRLVGVCRDFAVLYTSMLRHKGIPARMRVGFASYLDPKKVMKYDHWITEYWDEISKRWVLADPQIDEVQAQLFEIEVDISDLNRNRDFFVAGSAWKRARAGEVNSTCFRFSGTWKGFPCIRGNLLHDFQSLNKIELTPRDYWDSFSTKPEQELTVDDKSILDRIAELTVNPDDDFEALMGLYAELPRSKTIYDRLRTLGVVDGLEINEIDQLQESSVGRLGELADVGDQLTLPQAGISDYQPYEPPPHMNGDRPDYQQQVGIGDIKVRGAFQHNLKHINVTIPRHKLVVVTGVSGSGKSSLAFDTIYAEGQRRYVESLSSYARQFMDQMEKPKVDQIIGLSPAIAIEQKTVSKNPRSTVGTVTEILDYLRVLYARIGLAHCPQCGRVVESQSAAQITAHLLALPGGTHLELLAPVVRNRKGKHKRVLSAALGNGYIRVRVDGKRINLQDHSPGSIDLEKNKKHDIDLVIDRLVIPDDIDEEFGLRLADSVETTLKAAGGTLIVELADEEILLSEDNSCPHCDVSFPELQPQMFSFNSPFGMCPECNGLGVKLQVDPDLIIIHPELSLLDGASAWHGNLRKKNGNTWSAKVLTQLAEHYQVDLEIPWNELPESFRDMYLYGSGGEKIPIQYENKDGSFRGESLREAKGAIYHINRLFRQTRSEGSRRYHMQFMSKISCPKCAGERLSAEARFTTIAGIRLPEITSFSIENLHQWILELPGKLNEEQAPIADELIAEIKQRLGFLLNVGLHYLTLDRPAPTLSGGEGQRIRLASQIGSGLVGVLYILDEPSIGLHTRDHRALLDTLIHLRDIGNTVLVVEHDKDTMRAADWLIDLGPGPGILGGELVAAGPPEEIISESDSLTGQYLSGYKIVSPPRGFQRRDPQGWLILKSAKLHNLKSIDVHLPLGVLICLTGVSGSGKSSLVSKTLHPALARVLHRAKSIPGPHDGIEGLDQINKVINITQDPIGRNPRSNPSTYTKVMDEIRKVFALTPEAKARGYKPGRFSMNTKGGRCESCRGYGTKKVEMHFLPDVWVTCKECGGKRFNRQTLEITYKQKTISEILNMDVQEALTFFENIPAISKTLQMLHDVGLDYIKLGQSALTLSGGEAQRVKLAKELSRAATGKTLYILDEPTTGLHFADIQRLLDVLERLVAAGNTVVVIEHNLDVVKSADWVIDLGPEGGDKGGYIIAEGTPETVTLIKDSYTGKFLAERLAENQNVPV